MGCDTGADGREIELRISIHAPTWGATAHSQPCLNLRYTISIHAPTWGATV